MKRTSNWTKAPVVILIRFPILASLAVLILVGNYANQVFDWLCDILPAFD